MYHRNVVKPYIYVELEIKEDQSGWKINLQYRLLK